MGDNICLSENSGGLIAFDVYYSSFVSECVNNFSGNKQEM